MSSQPTESPPVKDSTVQTQCLAEPVGIGPRKWRLAIITVSLCCGTFLVALDTTILSVAVPSISTTFQAFGDVGWYGSAYLLTVTAFQPAFGNIFQLFDAKTTYLVVAVLFEGGSMQPNEAFSLLVYRSADSRSWIGDVCCQPQFRGLHLRSSGYWGWGCWIIPRRTQYCWAHRSLGRTTHVPGDRAQCFWYCCMSGATTGRNSHATCHLALVFLDVRGPLPSPPRERLGH